MNCPFLVLPYQRSPSRWKTFVLVFTHTIPFTGGVCAVVADAAVDAAGVLAGVELVAAAGAAGALVAAPPATGFTVTSGVIFVIVAAGTPAFFKSSTLV